VTRSPAPADPGRALRPGSNGPGDDAKPQLVIEDLGVDFTTDDGVVHAVDGVDLSVASGQTLGIVGESGCGKSVTCHSILKLTPPNGRIVSGNIRFEDRDLTHMPQQALAKLRGRDIAMIFQDPMSALNPVHSVGSQISESLTIHRGVPRKKALAEAADLLDLVGIPEPRLRLREFPHQLSGGMSQRVMIAMALACRPKLLIADEPTTALDVTIQAQILDLLRDLQKEIGMSIILITHDLGVVAEMADTVVVMYCGRVVECASAQDLFAAPRHPYTKGLIDSLPRIDHRVDDLAPVDGFLPSPFDLPPGCAFEPRCPNATDRCRADAPDGTAFGSDHLVSCYHPVSTAI
jgi:oligopeptide/dipeptide ABC transporter ATP-binding protein